MRSALVLILAILLIMGVVRLVRAVAGTGSTQTASSPSAPQATTPAPTVDGGGSSAGIVHTGTVGAGTWTVAAPVASTADTPVASASATPGASPSATHRAPRVHTYAVRVENGINVSADDTAREIAKVLADPRGWHGTENALFRQVADPAKADFTISLASPPTVHALCKPADTQSTWNCRRGKDVALNSDRWLHMTPTYTDRQGYRVYMINHEVGHLLGHKHETCPAKGHAAPVMLQQSMDLGGCRANPWPVYDGVA